MTRTVRPFGRLGGAYEVDQVGVWENRLAWLVAFAIIGLTPFAHRFMAGEATNCALIVGLFICFGLCADVARRGRRV